MQQTIFGTDGIRCQMNSSYLTEASLHKLGQAIAQWAPKQSHFLFGSDTRSSCETIKSIISQELFRYGHTVSDAQILPTPLLCTLIQSNQYDFGIMITASHNPAKDNGIKIITPTQKLSANDEKKVSALFWATSKQDLPPVEKKLPSILNAHEISTHYQRKIKKQLVHQKFDRFKIVIDCAHGATSSWALELFQNFGFEVITINNSPNGSNINQSSGALYPEQLLEHVQKENADFGCAFDGDGDRIVIVDSHGSIFNGDDILTIFAEHPRYHDETVFAGTIMSNQAVARYFKNRQKTFIRTNVGDKHIATTLRSHDARLGSEPSGHIIIHDHSFCSDGIFAALLFFDTLLCNPDIKLPLFTPYPSVKKNITVTKKKDLQEIKIRKIIKLYEKELSPGRLIVRYSGTEPLLRVTIEHQSKIFAQNMLQIIIKELKPYLCY